MKAKKNIIISLRMNRKKVQSTMKKNRKKVTKYDEEEPQEQEMKRITIPAMLATLESPEQKAKY